MKDLVTVSAMISSNRIILFSEEVYVTDCVSGTNLNSLLSKLYRKVHCFLLGYCKRLRFSRATDCGTNVPAGSYTRLSFFLCPISLSYTRLIPSPRDLSTSRMLSTSLLNPPTSTDAA